MVNTQIIVMSFSESLKSACPMRSVIPHPSDLRTLALSAVTICNKQHNLRLSALGVNSDLITDCISEVSSYNEVITISPLEDDKILALSNLVLLVYEEILDILKLVIPQLDTTEKNINVLKWLGDDLVLEY